MSNVDHSALLAELILLVDERFQSALKAAIADMERLDKIERMKISVRWDGDCERAWVGSSLDPSGFENRRENLRTSIDLIDGVPE